VACSSPTKMLTSASLSSLPSSGSLKALDYGVEPENGGTKTPGGAERDRVLRPVNREDDIGSPRRGRWCGKGSDKMLMQSSSSMASLRLPSAGGDTQTTGEHLIRRSDNRVPLDIGSPRRVMHGCGGVIVCTHPFCQLWALSRSNLYCYQRVDGSFPF
jgi:hypothetical protein